MERIFWERKGVHSQKNIKQFIPLTNVNGMLAMEMLALAKIGQLIGGIVWLKP
jgi:hypothetical protein